MKQFSDILLLTPNSIERTMMDTRSTTSGIAFILPTSCGDDGEKSPKVTSTKYKDVIKVRIQERLAGML